MFKESFSSHKGHIWPVCAWAHSSLHNLETHRSCQSWLFCHHQSGFWIQIQRCYLVWFCIFLPAFPEFLSLVLLPSQGDGHQGPSIWRLVMNFLVCVVTVSFLMATVPQLQRRKRAYHLTSFLRLELLSFVFISKDCFQTIFCLFGKGGKIGSVHILDFSAHCENM